MELREDACILLNEREPLKQRMAQELENRLRARLRSCSRLNASDNYVDVIKKRHPRVLVLDYLLGDKGTALDVLAAFQVEKIAIPVVVWTDEPSVSVAVGAMKMGAHDYIELSEGASVEKVMESIEFLLQHGLSRTRVRAAAEPLVMHSDEMVAVGRKLSALARSSAPILLLAGESGVGRSSLGRYYHSLRRVKSAVAQLDWSLYTGEIADLLPKAEDPCRPALLTEGATVCIDHIEFDSGELLEALCSFRFSETESLILGTSDFDTAKSCVRLLKCPVVEVPPLRERKADLLPLTQRFAAAVPEGNRIQKLPFRHELLEKIFAEIWPGNIAQYKASVIEASMSVNEPIDGSGKTLSEDIEQSWFNELLQAKASWERYNTVEDWSPALNQARRALREANGSVRIAAARLGTGVTQVRSALRVDEQESQG